MLVPHEGGRRFLPNSPEYATIRDWIAAGMPVDPPGTPALTKLTITPAEQVVVAPAEMDAMVAAALTTAGAEARRMAAIARGELRPVWLDDALAKATLGGWPSLPASE